LGDFAGSQESQGMNVRDFVGWDIFDNPLITLKSILHASGRYLRLCKLRANVYLIDL
jgi:hypothetical protein